MRLLQTTARRADRSSAGDVVLDRATRGVGVATAAYAITTPVRGVAVLWSTVDVALLLARR